MIAGRIGIGGLLLTAAVACAACSDATGTINGGTLRWHPGSGPTGDASPGMCSAGSTWSDLYQNYFGPQGKANCAGTGVCHGSASQAGSMASGYVCGPDKAGCYMGITSSTADLVPSGRSFSQTLLYVTLRKSDGSGTMPKQPADIVFSDSDLACLGDWYNGGTPNN